MDLQSFTLQIFEPKQTISYYTDVLGFRLLNEFSENDTTYYNLCFENTNIHIQLKYTASLQKTDYQQVATDNYWKYSLFVDNIQKIYKELQGQNYVINEPYQFSDIGYLAHTTDPENHQLEFIQKTFKQNTPTSFLEKENTALGLLTIRSKDPIKSITFYEDILDLKLFVRMYVDRKNGFTLYFLGNKDLKVFSPDIDAIENREWMYQQEHLFIEIQHYWNSEYDNDFVLNASQDNGLQSINFKGDLDLLKERLKKNRISYQEEKEKVAFKTIDNHIIICNTI